ncbi:MAG: MMPL family transporter, partial [Gammaproteobacteria bacterium]|nr:MMPL family transporter [Gammaproteobacteria bacterium]
MIIRYTEWILRWRYLIVTLSILATLGLGMGVKNLQFSNDYRVFFSKDNPQLNAFENLQNTYTKNDNVLFVVAPRDKTIFSIPTLSAIKEITDQAWQIPYSIRVDSITNFQHTYAEQDDLIVGDLISDPGSMNQQDLAYTRQVALNEPMLLKRLISPDAAYTGVNVIVQLPGIDLMAETPAVVSYARTMMNEIMQRYPDVEIRLSGIMMMNNAFPEASKRDGVSLIPLAFLAISIMLLILLRGLSGTFSTVVLVLFSIIAAMGTAGWVGIDLTPPSASAPIIILTIAIAGAVHLL